MANRSRRRQLLLTLISLAFLFARPSGAHMHLCLDGSGPATSYHPQDDDCPWTDHHHGGKTHSDHDVQMDDGLAKTLKAGALPPVFASSLALDQAGPPAGSSLIPVIARQPAPAFPAPYLRPPLRAPPRQA